MMQKSYCCKNRITSRASLTALCKIWIGTLCSWSVGLTGLLHSIDQPYKFFRCMGYSNIVMFTFGLLFGKVFGECRVPKTDISGCVEKGIT